MDSQDLGQHISHSFDAELEQWSGVGTADELGERPSSSQAGTN